MTDSLCLISDLHGCHGTMLRLLNQVAAQHPGTRLMFGGDLIDRGPNSRQVVEFAMANQIPTVMGNHCDLCLAYSAHTRRGYKAHCARDYAYDVWLHNGGEDALRSWNPDTTEWHKGLPKDVLDWMKALQPYLEPDAPLDANGKRLFLSHNGHGLAADEGNWWRALWARDTDFPDDGRFRVFGHSPVKTAQVTETYAAIDTGAAYAERGGGIMTALLWPSKTLLTQPFNECPCKPRFKVVGGCLTP